MSKTLERVRFWNENISSSQVLNRKIYNVSVLETKNFRLVWFWIKQLQCVNFQTKSFVLSGFGIDLFWKKLFFEEQISFINNDFECKIFLTSQIAEQKLYLKKRFDWIYTVETTKHSFLVLLYKECFGSKIFPEKLDFETKFFEKIQTLNKNFSWKTQFWNKVLTTWQFSIEFFSCSQLLKKNKLCRQILVKNFFVSSDFLNFFHLSLLLISSLAPQHVSFATFPSTQPCAITA